MGILQFEIVYVKLLGNTVCMQDKGKYLPSSYGGESAVEVRKIY